jgi:predicted acetyltransferase
MMEITITKAKRSDTPVLRQLYELYCHDFCDFMQSDVGENGMFTDDEFMVGLWPLKNFDAYLVRADGKLAGFVWVMRNRSVFAHGAMPYPDETHNLIDEFFVMRAYRKRGVGRYVAHALFDRYPGVWEVSEIMTNTPAQAFWRRIIGEYTGGNFTEVTLDTELWHGPVQVFRSKGKTEEARSKK